MNTFPVTLPDLTRTDIACVVLDRWRTAKASDQPAVADAVVHGWRERGLPPGMASLTSLTSLRGDAVLTYQQWTDIEAPQRTAHRADRIDNAEHEGSVEFRPLRRAVFEQTRAAGCLVVSTFDFDAPDHAAEWVDLLITALETNPAPIKGLLAQHLHLASVGATVLNCSEWNAAADHQAFLETEQSGEAWRRVETYPGVVHGPGARCLIHAVLHGDR